MVLRFRTIKEEIKSLLVLSLKLLPAGGSGYDVTTPPILNIQDPKGRWSWTTGTISVKGSVEEIQIIDTGFDYIDVPTVNLTGGNGSGAVLSGQLAKIVHKVNFNSNDNQVVSADNTIGFTTFHKFRDYERVVYKTNDVERNCWSFD